MSLSHPDLNPRQDLFCRRVLAGASAAEAARCAGYAPANAAHQGAALLADARIRQRIEELRRRAEQARAARVEALAAMLRRVYAAALDKGDLRAAVRCVEAEAKLRGLWPGGAAVDPFLGVAEPVETEPPETEPLVPADPQEPPQKPMNAEPHPAPARPDAAKPAIVVPDADAARGRTTPMNPHGTPYAAAPAPAASRPGAIRVLPCGGTVERYSRGPG